MNTNTSYIDELEQLEFADYADDYCPDYFGDELWAEFERDNAALAAEIQATAPQATAPHVSERVRNYALAYAAVAIPTIYALELFLRYFSV